MTSQEAITHLSHNQLKDCVRKLLDLVTQPPPTYIQLFQYTKLGDPPTLEPQRYTITLPEALDEVKRRYCQ